MRIRADTNNPAKVPNIGDLFIVSSVKKGAIWWTIELKRIDKKESARNVPHRGHKK